MPTVKEFEKRVERIEGVKINLKDKRGRDIRDDKETFQQYDVDSRLSGESTVSDLKEKVKIEYGPEVNVEVISNGKKVHGNTKIKNIRNN